MVDISFAFANAMVCAEVDKGSLIDDEMVAVILKGRLVRVIIVVETT
jgi:hypothetical protein